ncbi:MAG: hypothetical protein M3N33_00850 [Actinomycetota bacterium]|nr:hypothetical protein [Actinomycetota bacterium]
MESTAKLIQIIPAQGWGFIAPAEYFPLTCWGLTEDGEIIGYYYQGDRVVPARDLPDFGRYAHESEK